MSEPIRWLHLSDFHVGKDDWAQWRLFEKIIEHVADQKGKGFVPDLVFITGDIANAGRKSEYNDFRSGFLVPLLDALGGNEWHGILYAVPGNHDVDRNKHPDVDRVSASSSGSHFFDPNREGKAKRDIVSPRFKQYRLSAIGNVPGNWIHEPSGAFAEVCEIRGLRVGVVGVNTAWLSMDHKDFGKLTPGIPLVEAALDRIKACNLRIVLGHHPLHWLIEDEGARLRTLLGHHEVIYLHGHMHRAEGRREEGAGELFLVFQAGAAFQARDEEPWKNGLLWGEVDWHRAELRLSPRFWNPNQYDWPPESGRFPEKLRVTGSDYWWSWSLPGAQRAGAGRTPAWQAPPGWQVLDAAALEAHGREITAEEAARFFDGAEPDWSLALCPTLPRRAVVARLADRIAGYRGLERPHVTLLIGPGGEGKSMALRQAVIALLERVPGLRVLWRQDDSCGITAEQLQTLHEGDAPWLVATDAADLIAQNLHRGVQTLKGAGRGDLRFLLAARDSDWRTAGASRLNWRHYADFHEEPLSGLTHEDAEAITRAWASFGNAGLGEAAGQDEAELAERLHAAALADAAVGEGALLGGMLAVRVGDGMCGHVMSLMERLSDTKLSGGGSLYTAFAYMAVMHAEGLDFLSRPVLAEALGCDASALQKDVIFPLGREAGGGGGTLLLTRHRRIARAAVEVLREEYGEDIDERYVELAKAAVDANGKRHYVPELHRWDYHLPQHFLEHQPDLAIRISRALLDKGPENASLAVNLARLYRESGSPVQGAELLQGFAFPVGGNRGFWYE